MSKPEPAVFKDDAGNVWLVEEVIFPNLPAGVLIFAMQDACRVIWGSPIAWRNRENLKVLFDLSVVVPKGDPAA